MKGKVSILIPLYNKAAYVADTFQSALQQTYSNLEIIVVDDGSTDGSLEIAQQYAKQYPDKIRVYQQNHKGACAARNRAFALSSGAYIQYLDADDLLAPDKIEQQMAYFDGSGTEEYVVNGRYGRFREHKHEPIDWGPHPSIQKHLDPIDWILANHVSTIACWLTPRKLIQMTGEWNERLFINQDIEFFLRVLLHATKVYYCDRAKMYYRVIPGNGSVSQKFRTRLGLESNFHSIVSIEHHLLSKENSERIRRFIVNQYIQFLYRYYPIRNEYIHKALEKVKTYGGSTLRPEGGKLLKILDQIFGWKIALWIRFLLRYRVYRLKKS